MATVNPYLTDQILAALDEEFAVPPPRHYFPQAVIDMLRRSLPGVDERQLGEIVMHVGCATASLSKALEEAGAHPTEIGPVLATTLVGAGAALYRGQGAAAPGGSGVGGQL